MSRISTFSITNDLSKYYWAACAAAALCLSACHGGGGGYSGGGTPPDTTPPDTSIASGPSATTITSARTATFTFSATENGVTYEVSVDGAAYAAQTSPLQLTNLSDGTHNISVRARDAAGNVDLSPAIASWKVDATAPTAVIVFPTHMSYTDATVLHVRGTAHDANTISAVTVNGVAATSTDGFATWSAVVPTASATNTLTVTATDIASNVNNPADAVTVINKGQSLVSPRAMDFDSANNRILVSDQSLTAVLAIDAATGRATILSDRRNGSGPDIQGAEGIVVDSAGNRALIVDWLQNALLAVDLASGNRSFVSDSTASTTDTQLSLGASGVALDAAGNRAFILSRANGSVIAINLVNGARSVVSSATVGSGTAFGFAVSVVYDAVTNPAIPRLLVSDSSVHAIFAVNITTGDRSIVSSAVPTGTGTSLQWPSQIQLDAAGNRLLIVDSHSTRNALVAMDLATGNRTTLSDATTGSGTQLSAPVALALNRANQRAYAMDGYAANLIQVDLATQARSVIYSSNVGTGAAGYDSNGVVVQPAAGIPTSLYFISWSQNAVIRVDLSTGNRTIISDNSTGGATNFTFPTDMILDTRTGSTNQAFVLDNGSNSILSVNLVTGNRSLVANLNTSSPLTGSHLSSLALDATNNRIFVTDSGNQAVYAVDLANGARSVVTGSRGSGTNFTAPMDVVFDSVSNPTTPRLLVANSYQNSVYGLYAVNIASGDRAAFSSSNPIGAGLQFYSPTCASLDATGMRVLVTDTFHQNLMSVALATGDRTEISGAQLFDISVVGTGPSLMTPTGLDADFVNKVAYVAALNRHAIIAVDLVSGDRVLVTH